MEYLLCHPYLTLLPMRNEILEKYCHVPICPGWILCGSGSHCTNKATWLLGPPTHPARTFKGPPKWAAYVHHQISVNILLLSILANQIRCRAICAGHLVRNGISGNGPRTFIIWPSHLAQTLTFSSNKITVLSSMGTGRYYVNLSEVHSGSG